MELSEDNTPIITEEKDIKGLPIQKIYQGCIKSMLIDRETIRARIKELAQQIADYYQNRPYLIIVILNGSNLLWLDLFNELNEIYLSGKYENYINP